ncbi:MAG: hypothetical protein K0R25_757 [Rickettsiaceae bacterium]|jgi:predicted metal-dependent hydrolase|nr:hypothetical protein [Rickettsiaceae bacterium]
MSCTVKQYPELGEKSKDVVFKVTRTRKIRLCVKSNLQIRVSFPKYCSLKKAQDFFESKIIWVQNTLLTLAKRKEIAVKTQEQNLLKLTAKEFLERSHYLILRCRHLAAIHNFSVRKILLKKQKSIWGSCSVENNIYLNSSLAFLSDELIDYVLLHELVHTKVKDHSKKFWNELEKVLPNCRKLNRQLAKFAIEEHKF